MTFLLFKANDSGDDGFKSDFVATKDWQVIKEGQIVPSGLHYRMNLATGLKEAKLLETAPMKGSIHKSFKIVFNSCEYITK